VARTSHEPNFDACEQPDLGICMAMGYRSTPQPVPALVSLLAEDPDLGASLNERDLFAARREARALGHEVPRGPWDPAPLVAGADERWLGLFLVDGLVMIQASIGIRSGCELLGPGDLLRPWDAAEYTAAPLTSSLRTLKPSIVAVLDAEFAQRTAAWPSIASRLIGRIAVRARQLAMLHAVIQLRRVDSRLLILFWLLAQRWGTRGVDGIRVTLPLTHQILAMLVGAQRPTVTLSLARLAAGGLLVREGPDRWLLSAPAIELVADPKAIEPHPGGAFDGALEPSSV
jgi:CRP-like cAMP-binding protein